MLFLSAIGVAAACSRCLLPSGEETAKCVTAKSRLYLFMAHKHTKLYLTILYKLILHTYDRDKEMHGKSIIVTARSDDLRWFGLNMLLSERDLLVVIFNRLKYIVTDAMNNKFAGIHISHMPVLLCGCAVQIKEASQHLQQNPKSKRSIKLLRMK